MGVECTGSGLFLLAGAGFLSGVVFSLLVFVMFTVTRLEAIHIERENAKNERREVPCDGGDS